MATLPESLGWVNGIYQIETTDPVEGGASGIANQQAKELASRTKYLYDMFNNMMAPLVSGSGSIWWDGPINTIPAGWGENTDMRGRVPVAKTNNTDIQFDTMGNIGGTKTVTLTAANIPQLNVIGGTADTDAGDGVVATGTSTKAPIIIGTTGNASPQAFSVVNPYRVGMWIKWVGIGNGING